MFKLIHKDLIKIKCNKTHVMGKFLVLRTEYMRCLATSVFQKFSSDNEKKQSILKEILNKIKIKSQRQFLFINYPQKEIKFN